MRNLFLRLVFLMALVGALVVLPADLTGNKASASNSCFCDLEYTACIEGCPPLGQPGHFACIGACNLEWKNCSIPVNSQSNKDC